MAYMVIMCPYQLSTLLLVAVESPTMQQSHDNALTNRLDCYNHFMPQSIIRYAPAPPTTSRILLPAKAPKRQRSCSTYNRAAQEPHKFNPHLLHL
jgi:hypothetical protein